MKTDFIDDVISELNAANERTYGGKEREKRVREHEEKEKGRGVEGRM